MGRSRGLLALLAFALCALGFGVASATAEAPQLTTPIVSDVSYATAHVSAEGDRKDNDFVEWFYEISNDGANWERAQGSNVLGYLFEGSGMQKLEGDIEGLRPGTSYQVRVSTNYNGSLVSSPEPNPEFTTLSLDPPTVTINPVTTFTGTTATFTGEIDPNPPAGNPPAANVDWHFECSPGCPEVEGGTVSAGATGEDREVEAEATGLEPNTTYEVTLIGENAGDPVSDGPVTFKTDSVAPNVTTLPAFPLEGATRALLGGRVDPRNSATEYWVEYGPGSNGAYGSSTPRADAGSGGGSQLVNREVAGFAAGATYHFRLVAESAEGERTDGEDLTFTMPTPSPEPSGSECPNADTRVGLSNELPDCRAYELASPPDFGGASLFAPIDNTRASLFGRWNVVADDGDAVLSLVSTGGTSDSQGLADYYRSVRDADGWRTKYAGPPENTGVPWVPELQFATPSLDRLLFLTGKLALEPSDHDPDEFGLHDLYSIGSDGTFTHINTGPLEIPFSLEDPLFKGASPDLRKVVFSSNRRLTPDAPGGGTYWTDGQTTKYISTAESGGAVGTSADASLVVFVSPSGQDLYVWTEQSDATEKVLGPVFPDALAGDLVVDSMSADGTKVIFLTAAKMTASDTDISRDLYEYNTSTHDIELLSAPSGGGAAGNSDACAAPLPSGDRCDVAPVTGARDGTAAYFVSPEQIVSHRGVDGGLNLYLSTQGEVRFVATLDPADQMVMNSAGSRARSVRLSPDGKKLLFDSSAALTSYDNAGYREVYVYDSLSGTLACASCRPNGSPPTGDSAMSTLPGSVVDSKIGITAPTGTVNFDRHGERIFFNSPDALVHKDANGRFDVYQYNVATASPALISSGISERDSSYIGNGLDGRDVFFLTTDTLDARDKNGGVYKMYDAREGGGFPPPAPPPPCSGDTCQGGASVPSAAVPPGSAEFKGKGNVKQPARTRCGKHGRKVRRGGKTRCIKKKHGKHRAKKRNAKHNRGAGR